MEMPFDIDEQLEKLGKVPKPIRMAIVGGILVAIAVAYYFVAYQPKEEQVYQLRAKAAKLQQDLNQVRAVANNVGAFEREVADLERDLKEALTQLPNSKQFEDLLQDISTAGKKVGVAIKTIDRRPEKPHDFYAEVPFKLELEGNYHDIARFFDEVARLPRIVNMGGIKMKVIREGSSGPWLGVESTATTYRFLNKKA